MENGKIAFWGIFTHTGKRLLLIPFRERAIADSTLAGLNADKVKELHYCTLVKEPMIELPRQFVSADYNDRRYKIPFETPDGGKGMVRKLFRDITVTCLVQGKYIVTEEIMAHIFRKRTKVRYNGKSHEYDDFEAIAIERWPDNFDEILRYINDV